jgi:predicted DNA-binding transcriptional regulator AlpA
MSSHIETASTTEAAKIYKVSSRQLFNLVKAKQIPPPVRVGKRRLVWLISDIQDFLRAGGTPAFNARRLGRPRNSGKGV